MNDIATTARAGRPRASAKLLQGILVPIPTVFDYDGEVDEPGMRALVQFYLDAQVHGLFPCGSFGMGPAMSVDQRKRVAELIAETVNGRIPLVVHCGTVDVFSAIDLAKHAKGLGSLAIAIVPPFYYSDHTEYEILEHYRRIAEAVDSPLFIYDNPQYSGIHMQVERVLRLKEAIPSIRGIKLNIMSVERALEYLRLLPEDIAIFSAGVSNLLTGKPKGFDGTVNPPTAHVPELCVSFWDALALDDFAKAIHYHYQLDAIAGIVMELWKTRGRIAYKEALKLRGLEIKMFPRWPSKELGPEDVARLREVHERVGAGYFVGQRRVNVV